MNFKIRWIRLERQKTESYMTLQLPEAMYLEQAELWVEANLPPGWEVITGSPCTPDEEFDEHLYHHGN